MSHRVVVTGMGAITPLGNDVPTMWSALVEGRSGIWRISHFDPSPFTTQIAGEVKGFEARDHLTAKETRRLDRFTQFAVVAAQQAIQDAGLVLDAGDREQMGVVIGSAVGGIGTLVEQSEVLARRGPQRVSPFLIPMMLSNMASGQVAISFGLKGPNVAIVSACATGGDAIGEAAEIIRRGDAQVMVCGGSEASIVPVVLAGFAAMRSLSSRNDAPESASRPFDRRRDGFVMGEGAGIVILESLAHAQGRGARVYAEVSGYGMTANAVHVTAPGENGEGIARAMRRALRGAGLDPEEIDYLNAHGTSTRLNDRAETAAIKAVFGDYAYRLPISSTKSMMGHLLGAAGAVEAIICLQAIRHQIIPPTINYEHPDPDCNLDYVPNVARPCKVRVTMSNAMGFGGHNACLIFREFWAD